VPAPAAVVIDGAASERVATSGIRPRVLRVCDRAPARPDPRRRVVTTARYG